MQFVHTYTQIHSTNMHETVHDIANAIIMLYSAMLNMILISLLVSVCKEEKLAE
jgi:hypothetical protein